MGLIFESIGYNAQRCGYRSSSQLKPEKEKSTDLLLIERESFLPF